MKNNKVLRWIPRILTLVIVTLLFVYPFWWMLVNSLNTNAQVFGQPRLLPQGWKFENYVEIFQKQPFALHYFNTILVAVIGTLGAALIVRNKRRAPALTGANGGRSDDGFDIADGATPAPATTANAIAATEARADASAPTEVLQPLAPPATGPPAGPSASLNVADSGGAPTARYDFNLVDGPSSR